MRSVRCYQELLISLLSDVESLTDLPVPEAGVGM